MEKGYFERIQSEAKELTLHSMSITERYLPQVLREQEEHARLYFDAHVAEQIKQEHQAAQEARRQAIEAKARARAIAYLESALEARARQELVNEIDKNVVLFEATK